MQSIKIILLLLLITSCSKQQYPEMHYENMVLRKTVKENASQILIMQEIIADQRKTIKRIK